MGLGMNYLDGTGDVEENALHFLVALTFLTFLAVPLLLLLWFTLFEDLVILQGVWLRYGIDWVFPTLCVLSGWLLFRRERYTSALIVACVGFALIFYITVRCFGTINGRLYTKVRGGGSVYPSSIFDKIKDKVLP